MDSGYNIIREKLIDVSSIDYEDTTGFFFHTTVGGTIKYVPLDNQDDVGAEYGIITKTFEASESFNNCVIARKIYSADTTATGIYVGKPR